MWRSFKTPDRAACSGLRCRNSKIQGEQTYASYSHNCALAVITVLGWGQEEGAPTNELAFGLGGLPSLSLSDEPSLNAGPGTGLQVNYYPLSLRHRTLGSCRCLAAHHGGPVRRRVPIKRSQNFQAQLRSHRGP